jgi:hypothetical protein
MDAPKKRDPSCRCEGLTTAPTIFEDESIGETSVLESGDLDQHEMPTEAASDQALEPIPSGLVTKSFKE